MIFLSNGIRKRGNICIVNLNYKFNIDRTHMALKCWKTYYFGNRKGYIFYPFKVKLDIVLASGLFVYIAYSLNPSRMKSKIPIAIIAQAWVEVTHSYGWLLSSYYKMIVHFLILRKANPSSWRRHNGTCCFSLFIPWLGMMLIFANRIRRANIPSRHSQQEQYFVNY